MNKFKGILFCTDLDGTLFSDDKTVSRQNFEAIEYFKKNGGTFTFITGRIPQTAGKICEMIQPNAPIGCINGAGIYDHLSKKLLWQTFLPDGFTELIREVDRQLPDIGIQYNTEKNIYFNKDNPAMEDFRNATGLENIYCHYEDVTERVFKVVFGHRDKEQINALERLLTSHPLSGKFDFIRSEDLLFEILPKGVSKGTVLHKMAELCGMDMNKTVAVGDYDNDVSMIKAAGVGFAVANAVDKAKAVADYITVSNNESAIAHIIGLIDRGEIINVK